MVRKSFLTPSTVLKLIKKFKVCISIIITPLKASYCGSEKTVTGKYFYQCETLAEKRRKVASNAHSFME